MKLRFANIHTAFGLMWLLGAIGLVVYATIAWKLSGYAIFAASLGALIAVVARVIMFANVLESDRELSGEADNVMTGIRAGAVDFACGVAIVLLCWSASDMFSGNRFMLGWMVGGVLALIGFQMSGVIGVFIAQRDTIREHSAYDVRHDSVRRRD